MIFSVLKLENQAKRLFFLVLFSLLAFQQNVFSQCSTTFAPTLDCSYDPINTFTLGGVASIGNNNTEESCNSNGNYTFANPLRTLEIGSTITWSATVGNGTYYDGIGIWIDLDNDNFYSSSEFVSSSTPSTPNTLSPSGSFVMPSGVTGIPLRMRVRSAYADVPSASEACSNSIGSGYGETENYFVILTGGCTNPTISSTLAASRCDIGTLTLEATPSAGTIDWYADATGGSSLFTGTSFTTPSISTTTTYYAEAVDGSCVSASRTAVVATVNATPSITSTLSAASCDAGTLTLEATPSAGTIDWFADATGGTSLFTGTSFTTPSIATTTTYYAEVANGSCVNATREAVVATIGGCTKIRASQCGATISSVSTSVYANAVLGATGYKFEFTDVNSNVTILEKTTPWFKFAELNYLNNSAYSVRVSSLVGGVYSNYGDVCTLTLDLRIAIQASQCGATINSNTTAIYSATITGATGYRFELTDVNNNVTVLNNTNRYFTFSQLNFLNNSTYSVRVAALKGGIYSNFGPACNVTLDLRVAIQTSQCGVTVDSRSTAIYSGTISGATGYRFELTDVNNNVTVLNNTNRYFTFSQLNFLNNSTYSVRVAALKGGIYSNYGPACNVTLDIRTKIQPSQCGATITSPSAAVYCISITGVTGYRFEITDADDNVTILNNPSRYFRFSQLTYTNNATYSVRVSALKGGIYSTYGDACNVTISTSGGRPEEIVELKNMNEPMFDFEAFPNPSNGDFTISSSEAGTFNILNELGKLVRTVEITEANNNQVKVENMPNGAYFVTGTLNGEAVTKKVMVVR